MVDDTPSFFNLVAPEVLGNWGDYGSILLNGMFQEATQSLDRSGPFVPPISFPAFSDAVIVTRDTRMRLEASGMSGVGEFSPVQLRKVVLIDWQKWDKHRKLRGDQLPFNGEPEEYILHNPHDAETAAKIQPLWTWHPARIGRFLREDGVLRVEGILGRQDVFRLGDSGRRVVVNEKGMQCVRSICGEWVKFERIEYEILS